MVRIIEEKNGGWMGTVTQRKRERTKWGIFSPAKKVISGREVGCHDLPGTNSKKNLGTVWTSLPQGPKSEKTKTWPLRWQGGPAGSPVIALRSRRGEPDQKQTALLRGGIHRWGKNRKRRIYAFNAGYRGEKKEPQKDDFLMKKLCLNPE